jgi:hypothetical protein
MSDFIASKRTQRWEYAKAAAPLLHAMLAQAKELVALKKTSHDAVGTNFACMYDYGLDTEGVRFECILSDIEAALAPVEAVAAAHAAPPLRKEKEWDCAMRSRGGGRGGGRAKPY